MGYYRDLHEWLGALEAKGYLHRISRRIDKDTEMHPLARLQFRGLPERERKGWLFEDVVDVRGRRYDMPVALAVMAPSRSVYALGMGVDSPEEIPAKWAAAQTHPIPPRIVSSALCQEMVYQGAALDNAGGLGMLPVPISTPGFDAAPYLTATLCVTRDPDTGIQNMGTYRGALKATDRLGVRMSSRIGGAGGYLHWKKHNQRGEPMPCAIVIGCAPVVMFTGGMKLAV
ncbi:MAG TPA: UbiD family decarboxylase, partial [Candidatus Binatia bacterium]|nr:UbiD family decarboxylase [Candidatus Binatia bacterium]